MYQRTASYLAEASFSFFSLPVSPALPRSASPISSLFIPYNSPLACLARANPACKLWKTQNKTQSLCGGESQVYTFCCAALIYFEKKATPFDSASEIVLMDVKCITKQHYSSDLWPLKIKRNWSNCIVDKSLAVRIVNKSLALRLSLYL